MSLSPLHRGFLPASHFRAKEKRIDVESLSPLHRGFLPALAKTTSTQSATYKPFCTTPAENPWPTSSVFTGYKKSRLWALVRSREFLCAWRMPCIARIYEQHPGANPQSRQSARACVL